MTVQKIKSGRVPGKQADDFIGDLGQIFYNEELGDLRLSDGITPGGTPLSNGGGGGYILPKATATRLGGIKIGANINIDPVTGIASVAAPFSKDYNDLTNRPNLSIYQLSASAFDGNYNHLSNLPTIPTDVNQLTDASGLLGGGTGNASITVSNVPPTGPTVGQLWWDTGSGDLYIYFDNNWVPAVVTVVGPKGDTGATGLSAYQLAVDNGYSGTIIEWLASLKGADGASGATGSSAYQLAVDNGFVGTLSEWLASLVGPKGDKGDPGTGGGTTTVTEGATPPTSPNAGDLWWDITSGDLYIYYDTNWVPATTTINGTNGKSAYQIAVDNGFVGTEAEWLASLSANSAPIATTNTAGLVKPGTNVNISSDGTISVPKGAGINTVADIPDVNSTTGGAALNDGALLVYNASNNRWDTLNDLRAEITDGGFF